MKSLYCIYILCVLFSCKTKNNALESDLRLAGDNRSELKKVLRNYSLNLADSLKLRAAIFLIEKNGEQVFTLVKTMDASSEVIAVFHCK